MIRSERNGSTGYCQTVNSAQMALLALTLAACGDAGDGAGNGDAPPSACETQVACMIDQ